MEEALEQTAQTISNPALVGQSVHAHSGHIHVSFAFYQLFLRIIGNKFKGIFGPGLIVHVDWAW